MMRLLWNLIGGTLTLWLAQRFVPGVEFTGEMKYLILAGCFLGLINFFIKPILKIITLPLRILTFGLIGLVINMLIIWAVDIFFTELVIQGIVPLFWTSLIVWGIGFILGLL
jgi:putative membrane protein